MPMSGIVSVKAKPPAVVVPSVEKSSQIGQNSGRTSYQALDVMAYEELTTAIASSPGGMRGGL
jgi:hypothetical protein